MTRLPSIRGRIGRTLLGWALVWGTTLALAAWLAVRHEMNELLDDSLRAAAEALAGTLEGTAADASPALTATGSGRFAWQLVAHDGSARVLRASPQAPAAPLRLQPVPGFARSEGWRVYGQRLGAGGTWLYVAQSRAEQVEALGEVTLSVAGVTVPVFVLALLGLRRRVQRELLPLQTLSQRLARHDPRDAAATLGPAERLELAPVHEAVDGLSQRLARRLAHERAFTAHAAHALRTPLAGIDAQLAIAWREAPVALQPRLQRARDAAGRLQRVVAVLLSLFRSGATLHRLALDPAALRALVDRVPVQGLEVEVQADRPLQADADLVAAALANLLDNAVRHGARRLRIDTPRDGVLRLGDDGPGVDEARRIALRQALAQDNPGSPVGLGLMLVDQVARAHGGRLELPAGGPGFTVELQLHPDVALPATPVAPEPEESPV